jgi:hypothetical protein
VASKNPKSSLPPVQSDTMPVGRPSLFEQCAPKLLAEIENALPIKAAAARAGINIDTAMDWLAKGRTEKTGKYVEFLECYTRTRGIAQAKMVDRVSYLRSGRLAQRKFTARADVSGRFAKPEAQLTIQNNTQLNIGPSCSYILRFFSRDEGRRPVLYVFGKHS